METDRADARRALRFAGAVVAPVAAVTDRIEERAMVALPGGLAVALLAVARFVTLGDGGSPALGIYVAVIGGLAGR